MPHFSVTGVDADVVLLGAAVEDEVAGACGAAGYALGGPVLGLGGAGHLLTHAGVGPLDEAGAVECAGASGSVAVGGAAFGGRDADGLDAHAGGESSGFDAGGDWGCCGSLRRRGRGGYTARKSEG